MTINPDYVAQIQAFKKWAKAHLRQNINFSINYWSQPGTGRDVVEYGIWIRDVIRKESESLEEIIGLLPKLKELCLLHKERANV